MHEFTFSDISCPDRHVVLELPLKEFSIGHRLILLKQRNPLLCLPDANFNALPLKEQIFWLIEAVYTCAQSYAYRKRLESGVSRWERWRHNRVVKSWHRRRKRARVDWAVEIAKFRNYLGESRIITEFNERREGFPFLPTVPNPESKGRALGGPYDAALIQFLVEARLCGNEASALEYPVALAQIHFYTHLEREGHLHILNFVEFDFEQDCAARDLAEAKKNGFATAAEHFDHVYQQAKAEKEARQKAADEKSKNLKSNG